VIKPIFLLEEQLIPLPSLFFISHAFTNTIIVFKMSEIATILTSFQT
jgi:hypothetical protein